MRDFDDDCFDMDNGRLILGQQVINEADNIMQVGNKAYLNDKLIHFMARVDDQIVYKRWVFGEWKYEICNLQHFYLLYFHRSLQKRK